MQTCIDSASHPPFPPLFVSPCQLILSAVRYGEVMEAYLKGLEKAEGDLSKVSSVASFFVSRVDVLVDKQLEALGTEEAKALLGKVRPFFHLPSALWW